MKYQVVNLDCENPSYAYETERLAAVDAELLLRPVRPDNMPPPEAEEAVIRACADADIVLSERSDKPISARVMAALPRCRGIICYSVGTEAIDLAAASRHGIVVGNSADYCSEEVADHAVALLLATARQVMVMDRTVRAGGWHNFPKVGSIHRISTLTLGLLGLGRIAREVAKRMSGFGLKILAADPYLKGSSPVPGVELVPLQDLWRRSDLISVHVPLTPETRGLVGEAAFRAMKPSVLLVNTSRGGVIDEPALVRALRERRIAGAGLDVMAEEPLPAGHPLREFDQVVLTPHYGAGSVEAIAHMQRLVVDSAAAVLAGYWPPFPVNPAVTLRQPLRPWREFRAAG